MSRIFTSFIILIALIGFVVYFLMLYAYATPAAIMFKTYMSRFKAKFTRRKKNHKGGDSNG